jgi:hypothetical protein
VVILPVAWVAGVGEQFHGVPQGETIKERQKLIAEIERRYGETN